MIPAGCSIERAFEAVSDGKSSAVLFALGIRGAIGTITSIVVDYTNKYIDNVN